MYDTFRRAHLFVQIFGCVSFSAWLLFSIIAFVSIMKETMRFLFTIDKLTGSATLIYRADINNNVYSPSDRDVTKEPIFFLKRPKITKQMIRVPIEFTFGNNEGLDKILVYDRIKGRSNRIKCDGWKWKLILIHESSECYNFHLVLFQ